MSKATYYQRGEALDYLNSGVEKIELGEIIKLEERIGVAGDDIAPKQVGALHITGVFEFKKTSGNEIKMGKSVYFDGTGITEVEGSNTPAGFAAATATNSDTKILVRIG